MYIKGGGIFQCLFDLALIGRANQRVVVFGGEFGRNLDIQSNIIDHAVHWIGKDALHNANALGVGKPRWAQKPRT